jgi:Transposase DDE domain
MNEYCTASWCPLFPSYLRREKPKLRYKTHRAVDASHEIITAVKVTPGATDEGHEMTSLIDAHEANTERGLDTVVADSHYGTNENLLICRDKGINPHMPSIKALYEDTSSRKAGFPTTRKPIPIPVLRGRYSKSGQSIRISRTSSIRHQEKIVPPAP